MIGSLEVADPSTRRREDAGPPFLGDHGRLRSDRLYDHSDFPARFRLAQGKVELENPLAVHSFFQHDPIRVLTPRGTGEGFLSGVAET